MDGNGELKLLWIFNKKIFTLGGGGGGVGSGGGGQGDDVNGEKKFL